MSDKEMEDIAVTGTVVPNETSTKAGEENSNDSAEKIDQQQGIDGSTRTEEGTSKSGSISQSEPQQDGQQPQQQQPELKPSMNTFSSTAGPSAVSQGAVKSKTSSPAPQLLVNDELSVADRPPERDALAKGQNNGVPNSNSYQQETERDSTNGNESGAGQEPQVPELPASVNPSQVIGGAPLRQWINEEITPSLLGAMRAVSKERPEEPLKFLGEYFLKEHEKKKAQSDQ